MTTTVVRRDQHRKLDACRVSEILDAKGPYGSLAIAFNKTDPTILAPSYEPVLGPDRRPVLISLGMCKVLELSVGNEEDAENAQVPMVKIEALKNGDKVALALERMFSQAKEDIRTKRVTDCRFMDVNWVIVNTSPLQKSATFTGYVNTDIEVNPPFMYSGELVGYSRMPARPFPAEIIVRAVVQLVDPEIYACKVVVMQICA